MDVVFPRKKCFAVLSITAYVLQLYRALAIVAFSPFSERPENQSIFNEQYLNSYLSDTQSVRIVTINKMFLTILQETVYNYKANGWDRYPYVILKKTQITKNPQIPNSTTPP